MNDDKQDQVVILMLKEMPESMMLGALVAAVTTMMVELQSTFTALPEYVQDATGPVILLGGMIAKEQIRRFEASASPKEKKMLDEVKRSVAALKGVN